MKRWYWRLILCFVALSLASVAVAQDANRAAVIVSMGDGVIESRCVEFPEAAISGFELLVRSGLSIETELVGASPLVCRIGESGCPTSDCLCQCKGGGPCVYWSYWLNRGGNWRYAQVGAGMNEVSDGDIQGWVWDLGGPNEAPPPPEMTFEEVCSAGDVAAAVAEEAVPGAAVETPEFGGGQIEADGRRAPAALLTVGGIALVAVVGLAVLLVRRQSAP